MNFQSLEVWSDIVGLASAIALTIPGWKADSVASFVSELSAALGRAKAGGDPNGPRVLGEIQRDADEWKPSDRWFLRVGVLMLAGSFLLKMAHHAGWRIPG